MPETELPTDWRVERLGAFAHQVRRRHFVTEHREYPLLGVRWYGAGPFHRETVTSSTSQASQLYEVARGDLIYNRLFAWKASFGIIPPELDGYYVSGEFPTFLVDESRLDSRFLYYLLVQDPVCAFVDLESSGATSVSRNRWKEAQFRALEIPVPNIGTQRAIADFLDRETERIDELVEKKRRLIELLEERRTALISHAVAKGLDATVPMKDSGIAWLGDIPAHWESKRLKYALAMLIDTEHKTVHFVDDGEYPVIRTSDVRSGALLLDQARRTDRSGYIEWTRRGRPRQGDILLSREAPAGEAALVPPETELCLGQRMVLVRPDRRQLIAAFLVHWLYAPAVSVFIDLVSQGSTVRHLNMSDIPNIPVLCPPLPEQEAIAARSEEVNSRIAVLRAKLQQQLDKLAEYRQALITAAVTGQIDFSAQHADPEEVVA